MSGSSQPRFLAILVALAVFAAACTGGGDPEVVEDGSATGDDEQNDADSGGGGDDGDADVGAGGLGSAALPTEIDGPLVYSCAGRLIDADSLMTALDGEAPDAQALSDAGFDAAALGDPGAWRIVESAGLVVGAEALETEPPGLVMVEPDGAPFACVATRAGDFSLRQVAFAPTADGFAIESCVDPASVTVDRRSVGDATVVSVFTDDFEALPADCAVDGSVVLPEDAAGGAGEVGLLTSFTFPFPEAQPAVWHRLGFVVSPTSLDGTGLDSAPLADVECLANSLASEVFVEWSVVAPGFDVTVVADDADLFTVEFTSLDGSPSLARAGQAFVAAAGGLAEESVGTGFVNGFSDYAAPLQPRNYALRVDGGGVDAVQISCGEAGLSGEPATTTPTAPTLAVGGDLGAAKAVFENAAVSPFAYFRVIAICGGCGASPIDLQMSPSSGSGVSHLFDPPLSQQADSSATSAIVNPFELHDVLAAAEADGKDVEYTLDPLSGLPSQWTIDGVGGQILCFEVDTAPPDLRPGQVCETGRDLMSG